jgi:hypothetical protein
MPHLAWGKKDCATNAPAVHVLMVDLPIAKAGTALCAFHSPYDVKDPVVVHLSWPQDPERGFEVYGPFADHEAADLWVDKCMVAASQGWRLLQGTHYTTLHLDPPFDPDSLWEVGTDAMTQTH